MVFFCWKDWSLWVWLVFGVVVKNVWVFFNIVIGEIVGNSDVVIVKEKCWR